MDGDVWAGSESPLSQFIADHVERRLVAYEAKPDDITEHARIEASVNEGGYAERQLLELVQNARDAVYRGVGDGRIAVILTDDYLYCSNEGEPFDESGIRALVQSHLSPKRADEIGRFGLGFKSVLGISTKVDVFSRTGSIGFDVEECRATILGRVPEHRGPVPGLRIGFVRDMSVERSNDAVLDELAEWATTVVRLRIDGPHALRLADDLKEFPSEFILFSPRIRPLKIQDRRSGTDRSLQVERAEDGSWTIHHGDGARDEWRLNQATHRLSDAARADAGEAVGRESVELTWAAPLKPTRAPGAYWAYFPTRVEGSFGGIANATWKTNPDRQGLLDGTYNRELLGAFASLVLQSLPALSTERDPGRHLDFLPAEPGAGASWWNRSLHDAILGDGPTLPLVPDATGRLRTGTDLKLVPAQVTPQMIDRWDDLKTDRSAWVHRSCHTGNRRARARRLGATEGTIQEWLLEVASNGTPESSIIAIKIAHELFRINDYNCTIAVRNSSFVLVIGGGFETPDPLTLFFDDAGTNNDQNIHTVHPDVAANDDARSILAKTFKIKNLDATEILNIHLTQHSNDYERTGRLARASDRDYERTWRLARASDRDAACDLLEAHRSVVRVRCKDGTWRRVWDVLLPDGDDWQPPGVPDRAAVDRVFHHDDVDLLRAAGVVDAPFKGGLERGGVSGQTNDVFQGYISWGEQQYRQLERRESWSPVPSCATAAGPLSVAAALEGQAKETYLTRLFDLAKAEPEITWYNAANERSGRHRLASPAQWAFMSGRFEVPTSLGPRPTPECAGTAVDRWRNVLPVVIEDAFLHLPQALKDLPPAVVAAAYARCLDVGDVDEAGAFYAAACAAELAPPETVLARVGATAGRFPRADARLAHARGLAARAGATTPIVVVPSPGDVERMAREWHIAIATGSAPCRWYGERPPDQASDRFPGLAGDVARLLDGVTLVACDRIVQEGDEALGTHSQAVDWHWDGIARTFRHVAGIDDLALLRVLLEEVGVAADQIDGILEGAQVVADERRAATLRAIESDEARFAKMLDPQAIASLLPRGVVGQVPPSGLALAHAAFALHGSAVLAKYRSEMRAAGLNAPDRWGASETALAFVRRYGFDDAFAGEPAAVRGPFIDVDGPISLGPLHDYQVEIATRIQEFVAGDSPGRALLSLPTGAGKTRVVVEALVDALTQGQVRGHVLWIADREELCEQAVQAWREVWRWRGGAGTLRISREWGGRDGASAPGSPDFRVVVASVQTLHRRVGARADAWAAGTACVVIDEAHGSTTPSYTKILEELGLFRGRTPRPMLGLSATPFRGRDPSQDGQTAHLVRRYDSRRLDEGVFEGNDAYPLLRRKQILSEADFETVGGGNVDPTDEDLEHFRNFREMSDRMLKELGQDPDRNERIVERVAAIAPDWPTIIFATSVANAQVLAGLLAIRGITARAISSETDPSARRDAIARFRNGTVRVLTNFGVLTAGFDAPKTRAIIVARPIFSPGIYMQAIGRGLRGPANGGTDRCLIVNVEDNVDRFGERLAFRELEYLWGMDVRAQA